MGWRLTVWVLGSVAGALIVALPDDDARLLSLSASHGPSAADLVGIVILVAAWLPVVHLLWIRRAALRGRSAVLPALLGLAGILILLVTITADMRHEWVVGAALLIGAQLLALARIGAAPAEP